MNSSPQSSDLKQYSLRNQQGASATILNYGARLTALNIPGRHQGPINTVLGFDQPETYLRDTMFHGAIAGRYCNRIANGQFQLGNQRFQLPLNDGSHHLHGGHGFDQRLWQLLDHRENRVGLELISADGDQGYPGNLRIELWYTLHDDHCLSLRWRASSDRDTIVSLTNHSYFNLAGQGDVSQHWLRIAADHYTPVDSQLIPTGELMSVEGSIFDFRKPRQLQPYLNGELPALKATNGIDHNWARGHCGELLPSAELYCPDSELLLQVASTLPGVQCYTGNALGDTGEHRCHEGVCLETQYYPDSPNRPQFPSPRLKTGEEMEHETRYQFSWCDSELFQNGVR